MNKLASLWSALDLSKRGPQIYRISDTITATIFLAKYISKCENSFYAKAGELFSGVWMNEKVIQALESRPDSCNMSIILGPNMDFYDDKILAWSIIDDKIKLYKQKKREGRHYRVFDDFCLSIEDYHPPLSDQRETIFFDEFNDYAKKYINIHNNLISLGSLVLINKKNYEDELKYIIQDKRVKKGYVIKKAHDIEYLEKILKK